MPEITSRLRWLPVLAALMVASASQAATFDVNSSADDPDTAPGDGVCLTAQLACTLRAAVSEANSLAGPDTISIDAGAQPLITLVNGPLTIGESVTVAGPGEDLLAVDGNGDRVLEITAGTVQLTGVTLQNGSGSGGAGVRLTGGDFTLEASTLIGHVGTSSTGGAVQVTGGSATLDDCVVGTLSSPNYSPGGGGGLAVSGGTLTLRNGTVVAYNSSGGTGGGIYVSAGTLLVSDSTISNNTAASGGGGIFSESGFSSGEHPTIDIAGSAIHGNTTTGGSGGGIRVGDPQVLHVTNSTISGNEATTGTGGGIYAVGSTTLANVTVAENRAPGDQGGGLQAVGGNGNVHLRNSVIARNTAASNPDCGFDGSPLGQVLSQGYNLFPSSCGASQLGDLATGCPASCLGSLQADGTHPIPDDQSPVVDAANPAGCTAADGTALLLDQLGTSRSQGVACDMGAFELAQTPQCDDETDNDADGFCDATFGTCTDGSTPGDPGCADATSPIEDPACDDQIDNDGDGFCDTAAGTCTDGSTPGDPGCASADSSTENPACDDGVDNDLDGLTDVADPDCTVASASYEGPPATYSVSNPNDTGSGSLREAIQNANSSPGPDTIAFDPAVRGTITLSSGGLAISDSVTIVGPGEDLLALDGDGTRVLVITGGSVIITGLTLRDGSGAGGAGVLVSGGDLTLGSSTLVGHTATSSTGGALKVEAGASATLDDCVVGTASSPNYAPGGGGGLAVSGGSLTLRNGTVVAYNSSGTTGGGIYMSSGMLDVSDSTVENNAAATDGGGLFTESGVVGTVNVERSTFSDNQASGGQGGGIYVGTQQSLNLVNGTISGNEASNGTGGGIYAVGDANLANATVAYNRAPNGEGGGVQAVGASGKINLRSSMVASNTAASNPDCGVDGGPIGEVISEGFNLFGTDGECPCLPTGDQCGTVSEPLDPLVFGLGLNGGPTRTHALYPQSPAVDTGNTIAGCTDLSGQVLVEDQRGESRPFGAACDIGAFERDPDVVWVHAIDGTLGTYGDALAATVDAAGDVIAAGYLRSAGASSPDFAVIKVSGTTGAELWRQEIDGANSGLDQASAVTVDAAGDVIVSGYLLNSGSSSDFAVIKLAGPTGAELWRQEIDGTASSSDAALAVEADAAGDVVAAGYLANTGSSGDFAVIKLSGTTGAELWRQEIDGTNPYDYDVANDVAVDAAGDVVAAGYLAKEETPGVASTDLAVIKLSGITGTELWRQEIDGTDVFDEDVAEAVAVDAAGDVIVSGYLLNSGSGTDFAVIKFSGNSGAELWRQEIDGTGYDFAYAVGVDAAADVIAAGVLRNTGSSGDFAVIKLSGTTGVELWRQEIDGTDSSSDEALAVTLDAAGDVVAAGALRNTGSSGDFAVIKLSGTTGAELWREQFNGTASYFDSAEAVTTDPAGDVIAAGYLRSSSSGPDFTVMKLAGALEASCADGLDNDGDGFCDTLGATCTDGATPGDPGCDTSGDSSERSPALVCDDGADNDGDGYVDTADPACSSGSPYLPDPTAPREETQCQDGVNNDLGQDPNSGPALRDFDGGQSIWGTCSGAPGGCPIGVSDPDGDGVANPDPQCTGRPWKNAEKKPSSCGLGAELALLLPPLMWLWTRRRCAC